MKAKQYTVKSWKLEARGEICEKVCQFNESHLHELHNMGIYTDLYPGDDGGLPLEHALKLINKWNGMGADYSYWISYSK